MAKRGRKIPEGEEREARDVQVSIYVTEKERDKLGVIAERLGFRSKSALVAYVLEPLVRDGFSGISFFRLGSHFANLVKNIPEASFAREQVNIFKKYSVPRIEDVNREQK